METTPFRLADGRLLAALKVQPGAGQNAIAGIETLGDGRAVLKLKVTAAPEGGKANAAVIQLLAKTWKLPKSRLAVVYGQTARMKILQIADADAALLRRLETEAASV